ncbi:MAG TPA: LLM class flavin-dependent oxidoreductase [Thermomicrobiales bacterium]|nr:LLM class flavin-dependent oxidoreductase [Thermomicrobiales bacterium]
MAAERSQNRPLKIGVQLPEVERVAPWSDLARMATTAEALGYDSIWVGDHLIFRDGEEAPRGPWEAWTVMAAIAAITERVEIGPLVACTSFHNPAMIAKKAATLDEVSGGRLILGLGAGWNQAEYAAFGYPYDHRVSRFEEAFTIIRRLLAGEEFDFHGDYYTLEDCQILPPGPRAEGPPLMIGSAGERMLDITMPYAQSWNAWYAWFGNRPENLGPWMQKVDEACQRVGRDPQTVERTCAVYVGLTGGKGRHVGATDEAKLPPLTGSTEELSTAMRQYASAGISHVQLVLDPITLEAIEEFAPVLEELDRG